MREMSPRVESAYNYWTRKLRNMFDNDFENNEAFYSMNGKEEYQWIQDILMEVYESISIAQQELYEATRGYGDLD